MNSVNLKPIWDELIEIYKTFADICDRHHLRYYVTDGCAIGAVRHKGFIPWDDDLDVSMPRPDYEKFMEIAPKELPGNLVAFDRRQCPEMKLLFGKIQETREEKVHEVEGKSGLVLSNGLYMDIFPIDGCPSSFFKEMWLKVRLLALLGVQRFRSNGFSCYSVKGKLMWIFGWLCTVCSHNMRKIQSTDDILDAKNSLVENYEYDKCNRVVRLPNAINRLIIHDKTVWGDGVKAPFYGIEIILPSNVNAHLRALFGDYMELPSPEKRHPNHAFGTSYFPWWLGPAKT